MVNKTGGDVFDRDQAEKFLFPAKGLGGGGQLDVRMEVSPDHPDPDLRGVARRVKFFNLESWHKEWTEVAAKNQDLAAGFEQENRRQTAHEFYLRAADFYRRAVVHMPETDPRMLPTYKKLEDNFAKAWSVVTPPFERVEIPYDGHKLRHFSGWDVASQVQNCRWSIITAAPTASCCAVRTAAPANIPGEGCTSSTSTPPATAAACAIISFTRQRIPNASPKQ